jgi:hypothetical protein
MKDPLAPRPSPARGEPLHGGHSPTHQKIEDDLSR